MWYNQKAKKALLKLGMDHIRDGLFQEGGELVHEAKYGDGSKTFENLYNLLRRVCWWDDESIEDFMIILHSKYHPVKAHLLAE